MKKPLLKDKKIFITSAASGIGRSSGLMRKNNDQ